jgi:5-methylthioadenosine/S-adenosylhomocysteine deaminase
VDELTLVNGLILADPDEGIITPHQSTRIARGKLVQVNGSRDPHARYESVLDCSGCLIMPGLINGHTHAAMSLLRGLADDLPLESWLNEYIFPSERRYVEPGLVYLGTALSAIEMALNGITTCADGYFFMEHAAEAFLDVGLRAVVAQGILDVPTPDALDTGSWRERAERFLASCPRSPSISPALFCHSAYLCSPGTLREAADLATKSGILLFSHVSETSFEVEEIRSRYGRPPVEHLDSLGLLGERFVAVHCVHVSEDEQDLLARSGTRVVHCPESNMKLASGSSPVGDLCARGIILGLGTDGPASNNNLDMFEEMRTASLAAKLVTHDPQALGARRVLKMATIDGARALGMDDRIGSLVPGKLADVVVVDLNKPHLTPLYDPISHLVYAARGSDVRDVIVNGVVVVRQGKIQTIDESNIKRRARAMASEIGRQVGAQAYGV